MADATRIWEYSEYYWSCCSLPLPLCRRTKNNAISPSFLSRESGMFGGTPTPSPPPEPQQKFSSFSSFSQNSHIFSKNLSYYKQNKKFLMVRFVGSCTTVWYGTTTKKSFVPFVLRFDCAININDPSLGLLQVRYESYPHATNVGSRRQRKRPRSAE